MKAMGQQVTCSLPHLIVADGNGMDLDLGAHEVIGQRHTTGSPTRATAEYHIGNLAVLFNQLLKSRQVSPEADLRSRVRVSYNEKMMF